MMAPTRRLPSRPATAPSTVFPGLTEGMSLCLPMELPTKYAALSPTQVAAIGNARSVAPSRACPPPAPRSMPGGYRRKMAKEKHPPPRTTPSNVNEMAPRGRPRGHRSLMARTEAKRKTSRITPRAQGAVASYERMAPASRMMARLPAPPRAKNARVPPGSARTKSSQVASTAMSPMTTVSGHPPRARMRMTRGIPTAATASLRPRSPEDIRTCFLLSRARHPSKPSLTLLIIENRCKKVLAREIGPENGRDVDFGIRQLPEHEIADAHLAGGPNQEIGVG